MVNILNKKMKSILAWTALTGFILALLKRVFHGSFCLKKTGDVDTCTEEDELTAKEKININTADVEELASVPNVSLPVAKNIVSYREQNGAYCQNSDLLHVRGIGPKILGLIEEYICAE
jgi:competence ComEA-like helix-hairpin-helix protein